MGKPCCNYYYNIISYHIISQLSYKYFFFSFFFSLDELAFISIIISYLIISYHMFVSFISKMLLKIYNIYLRKKKKETLFCCYSCIIIYLEGEVRDFEMLTILTFKRTTYTHTYTIFIFIFFIFSSSSLLSSSLSLFPTILTYYLLDYISLSLSISIEIRDKVIYF